MKKIIALIILIATLCTAFAVSAVAYFGTAADVVASNVTVIRTALRGKKICFSDTDIKSALALANFDSITVTKIPSSTEGTLLLAGRRIAEGKSIKRKNIPSLVFIPASDAVEEAEFSFTVDGYAGGSEIKCILKFIDKVNYAPEAADESESVNTVKTQESISTHGKMLGKDPEGDKLEYMIVSYPKSGVLRVTDDHGRYVYTPKSGYTGTDGFTYVLRDEYGNYSKPISVKINVMKRMSDVEFEDMVGAKAYNAAIAMNAMGIMSGKIIGDDTYFMPEEKVSRAEFVAMAMKSVGIRADSTITASFFDDNAEIPKSLLGYVATAQRTGIINGDFADGRLLFRPNEPITKYEAAMVMASLIGADTEGEESVFAEEDNIPVWARPGVCAMYSLKIFEYGENGEASEIVTRADAASYLYKLAEIK